MEILGALAFVSFVALLLCAIVAAHRVRLDAGERRKPAMMDRRARVVWEVGMWGGA
jgi:hypothetical protein